MATTAAETAGHPAEKEKEKVEKRRALGRGLESWLPGPRVVAGTAGNAAVPRQAGVAPVQGGGAAEKTQIPHSVRDDSAERDSGVEASQHDHVGADLSAVVEMDAVSRAEPALSLPKGVPAPHDQLPTSLNFPVFTS